MFVKLPSAFAYVVFSANGLAWPVCSMTPDSGTLPSDTGTDA